MDKLDPTQQALLRLLRPNPRTGKVAAVEVQRRPGMSGYTTSEVSPEQAGRMLAQGGYRSAGDEEWKEMLGRMDTEGVAPYHLPGGEEQWTSTFDPGNDIPVLMHAGSAQALGRRMYTYPEVMEERARRAEQRGVTALDERGEPVRTTLWSAKQHGWKVLPEGAKVPEVEDDTPPPMAPADQRPPQRQRKGDGMKALAALLGLNGGK